MSRPTRHLCIATGQNLANLIPSLQLGATEVLILETPAMREAATNLKRALEARGVGCKRIAFDDATPETIRASAEAIAMELGTEPLLFNVTGGHKLMTLALAENLEALADDLHLVYAETRHDRLDWLKPSPGIEPMTNALGIDDILRAQGYRRTADSNQDAFWQADADARASLTRKMGDDAERYERFFGTLNRLADYALADEDRFDPRQEFEYAPGGRNAELLREASRLGLVQWDDDTLITFTSREAAAYFRGGWLEEYVWYKLRGLRPHDWAVNLKTQSYATQVENEFDAVVAHRNRLLVIECKTAGFGRNEARDVGYIYKLAQLSDQIGGSMSQKLLLSARPINADVRQRARDYRVNILAAAEIRQVVDYLRRWLQG